MKKTYTLCLALLMAVLAAGCGGLDPNLHITTDSLPNAQIAAAYAAAISARGGLPPYSWTLEQGRWPAGVALNTATGNVNGSPNETGNFPVTVSVTDSSTPPQSYRHTFNFKVGNGGLQVATSSLPIGTISAVYAATLSATGGTEPYVWTLVKGQLPSGLTLQTDGKISGTPIANGTSSFEVRVEDANRHTTTANLSITVGKTVTPAMNSLSPSSGSTAGGTAVAITGSNFLAGASVTFGGVAAPSVIVSSASQILVITPAHASGTVPVVVQENGQSSASTSNFTYQTQPQMQITTTSLPSGAVSVAYAAALAAANGASPYTWTRTSGQLPSGLGLQSTGSISGTPTQSGTFLFSVQATDSSGATASASFSINIGAPSTPVISGVSPSSGPISGGTNVTISGANFAAGATVTFGGMAASSVVVNGPTQIQAMTPSHLAGTVGVMVAENGQSSPSGTNFTYNSLSPTIGAVSPNNGPTAGGTSVTISGTNFLAGALVLFGTVPATNVSVVSATQIQAVTPANAAGPSNVIVQDPGNLNAALSGGFTYNTSQSGPPTISAVSPTSGAPGTQVTITGTNFNSVDTVSFGSNPASATFVSATQLTSTVPNVSAGTYNLTVTDPDPASATMNNAFNVTAAPPAQSLLSGCTVSTSNSPNCSLPSGWNWVIAEGFDSGSLGSSNESTMGSLGITSQQSHTGGHSIGSVISCDQCDTQWFLNAGLGSFSDVYASYWEWLDSNALFNDEMIMADLQNQAGGTFNQENVFDLYDWGPNFNISNPAAVVIGNGNADFSCPAGSTCNAVNPGPGAWHQWEFWWHPSTGGSNGFMTMYEDGKVVAQVQNYNINGSVTMSGNSTLYLGGPYTKLLWTTNGSGTGSCTALGTGQGIDYNGGGVSFSALGSKCPPAAPTFNRYIDDIVVMKK